MRYERMKDAYVPDGPDDLAYCIFKQGDDEDAECGVCAADVESVQFEGVLVDEPRNGWLDPARIGTLVTLRPCGHRVYLRAGEAAARVVTFPVGVPA